MPGVLPVDNPGRFGAWANGPINDPAVTPPPSASTAPTSGDTASTPLAPSTPTSSTGDYLWRNPNNSSTPGNGGSYGVGGLGPGGPTGQTYNGMNVMSLDEGGVVDVEGDNDDDDQQPSDPTQVIQNALGWGRQRAGLPAVFYGDQPDATQIGDVVGSPGDWPVAGMAGALGQAKNNNAMRSPAPLDPTNIAPMPDFKQRMQNTAGKTNSFAGGGVIPPSPDDQSNQGTGAQLPDPRKTMGYLTGEGGIPPDAAAALEARVDPQGQMDPAERKLAAITSSRDPQTQFGLMQYYRTLYNAHSGAAQAAMDQGNMALAAHHATEAMSNVPTGQNIKFMPAQGGLAVQSKKIGQKQQGMDDGGVVKPNPEDKWWDEDYLDKVANGTPYPAPKEDTPTKKTKGYAEGGAVDTDNPSVMMRSYAAGGGIDPGQGGSDEPDDEEVTPNPVSGNPVSDASGVIPPAPPSDDDSGPPQDPNTPAAMGDLGTDTGGSQSIIPFDAIKGLFKKGYDWLVEKGVMTPPSMPVSHRGGLPGLVNSAARGLNNAAAQGLGYLGQGAGTAYNWTTGQGPFENADEPDTQTAIQANQPGQAPAADGVAPQGFDTSNLNRSMSQAIQDQKNFQQKRGAGTSPTPDALTKYQQDASRIFGNSTSTAAQRNQYVAERMKEEQLNQSRLANTKAMYGEGGKSGLEQYKQGQINARNAANNAEKLMSMQIKVSNSNANAQQSNLVKLISGQLIANPSLASDPQKVQQAIAPYLAQMKQLGVSPQDIMQTVQSVNSPQAGAQGNGGMPTVNSKADYDALASGTSFVDAQGKRWTKP